MTTETKTTTRAGIIDIGTSSLKLTIGEADGEGIKILEFLKNNLPIGRYTFLRGGISQDIIQQIIKVLENYKRILQEYDVSDCKVIATTAVREAKNGDIFIDTVFRKTGLKIEVLTVCDTIYYLDSYLSFKLADSYPIQEKKVLISELGSGSLDVSFLNKGSTSLSLGLPVGTLRIGQLINSLDGSLIENYEAIREYIETEMLSLKDALPTALDDIIVIDEKYSDYLFHILPEKERLSNLYFYNREESEVLLGELIDKSAEEIARQYRMPTDIAETIVPFVIILDIFLTFLEKESIFILETSLSEAVLANVVLGVELSKKYDRSHQLVSMARYYCDKYKVSYQASKHVAKISEALFTSLKGHLGLDDEHLIYLTLAAYLRKIGTYIHNRAYHRHTEYIVNSLNFFSLTDEEVKIIACVARYHRKAAPNNAHPLYASLSLQNRLLVQKLSSILRIANALDVSQKQKAEKISVEINEDQNVTIIAETADNFSLERMEFLEKKGLFSNISGSDIHLVVKGGADL